jgi:hypothetical protein
VLADLDVSTTKISYFFLPSQTVVNGGFENVVNTAVREALIANGNADVLVALEQQVKYDANGKVESITVSGYPAKYVNFRNATSQDMDIVRSARIATYGQDNLEILYPQTNTNVKIKE